MFEIIFEAIPGCVMQLYALLSMLEEGRSVSTQAYLSLLVSALSAGYIVSVRGRRGGARRALARAPRWRGRRSPQPSSLRNHSPQSAITTYDYDISAQKRKNEPEFYGFIPDGVPGAIVFACMVLNSALLLLARSACAALLMLVQPSIFLYYVLGDCAFFFLQKAARGDIRCFLDKDGWVGTVLFDFLFQLCYKLVVDYTGLVQCRGPGCLGGCYWTGNMVGERASEASAKTVLLLRRICHRLPPTNSSFGLASLVARRSWPSPPPSAPSPSTLRATPPRAATSTSPPPGRSPPPPAAPGSQFSSSSSSS
jgi:hypothetical protein